MTYNEEAPVLEEKIEWLTYVLSHCEMLDDIDEEQRIIVLLNSAINELNDLKLENGIC